MKIVNYEIIFAPLLSPRLLKAMNNAYKIRLGLLFLFINLQHFTISKIAEGPRRNFGELMNAMNKIFFNKKRMHTNELIKNSYPAPQQHGSRPLSRGVVPPLPSPPGPGRPRGPRAPVPPDPHEGAPVHPGPPRVPAAHGGPAGGESTTTTDASSVIFNFN